MFVQDSKKFLLELYRRFKLEVSRPEGGLTTRSGFTNEVYLTGKADVCWADRPIEERAFCVGCHRHKGMDRTNCGALMLVDRLAAIEDILGDEYDLDRLSLLCNQRMTMRDELSQRFSLTANIPLDRLRELVEADREGRCVVLPRLEPWQGDPPGEPGPQGPPGLCPNCNDWRGLVWDETTGGSRCTICGWTNAKT